MDLLLRHLWKHFPNESLEIFFEKSVKKCLKSDIYWINFRKNPWGISEAFVLFLLNYNPQISEGFFLNISRSDIQKHDDLHQQEQNL